MKSLTWVTVLCAVSFLAAPMGAQSPDDPPLRVARLSYVDGGVSFRPDNTADWTPATLNFPLTTGDRLWTDKEAFADLRIGATAFHLAAETAFGILGLDSKLARVSLTQGTLYLRIPRLDEDQVYEVDTPAAAISLRQTGDYRFAVSDDGSGTLITVRSGEAKARAGNHTYTVHPGQTLRVMGTDSLEVDVVDADTPDPWEEW